MGKRGKRPVAVRLDPAPTRGRPVPHRSGGRESECTSSQDGIDGRPQKKYKSYYSSFNINISCPVNEISEILTAATLNDNNFEKLENEIYNFIGKEGKFGNMVAENFSLSNLALKGLVKRSNKFFYKGLKLSRKE